MSTGRLTLAQQLKELHNKAPIVEADPETAYSSLGGLKLAEDASIGRGHYAEVGKSRLRDAAASTFSELDAKYGVGQSSSGKAKRVKIFDDDESDPEEENGMAMGEDADDVDDDEGDSEDDEDDEDDEEDDEDEEDEEVDEDEEDQGDEDDDEDEDEVEYTRPLQTLNKTVSTASLDPIAAIKASKAKDIEKGRSIKQQQAFFDDALALRISFQKVLTCSQQIISARKRKAAEMEAVDVEGEGDSDSRRDALRSLATLNERMFEIRHRFSLPGSEITQLDRPSDEDAAEKALDEGYWLRSAKDSLAITDGSHEQLVSILNKWSTKVQAATMLQAGNNKFSNAGQVGVVEAIETGLNAKARITDSRDFNEIEEGFYKSLLREVIEARAGSTSGPGQDLLNMRKEKKKKREAERGGSKGRRLRYTVHEKAQNFAVPIPLEQGWHDEQIDELFSSLLGGAGLEGAGGELETFSALNGVLEEDIPGLDMQGGMVAGLRVF